MTSKDARTQSPATQLSAEAVSPITTYFRVCDGVRVRFADNKADSDISVLMLAPWPDPPPPSLWAFRRIWQRVSALGRSPSTCRDSATSDGRPELIAPDASGEFLARLIDEWALGSPHVVGPDVGTAAALKSPAIASWNFSRSRKRNPSCGGRIASPAFGSPGGKVPRSVSTDSPLVRREGRDVDERRHFGMVARLGDHRSAIGMANEDDGFALGADDHVGRLDIALE